MHHPGSCQQEGQLQQHTVSLSEPPTTCVASARRRRPNLQNCVSHCMFNLLRSPTPDPDTVANLLRCPLEEKLSVESDGNNGRSSFCRRYVVRLSDNLQLTGGSICFGHRAHTESESACESEDEGGGVSAGVGPRVEWQGHEVW